MHQSTIGVGAGIGAWAAGCANRLPALAHAVPQYVTSTTINVDDDRTGRRYAHELALRLAKIKGGQLEITMLENAEERAAA